MLSLYIYLYIYIYACVCSICIYACIHARTHAQPHSIMPHLLMHAQPHSFMLDLDTSGFKEYERGGIVTQVKETKTLAFKTLAQVSRGVVGVQDL